MKHRALSLVFLLPGALFAQTKSHTFTFGQFSTGSTTAVVQTWDGVANAYPGDMGTVTLNMLDYPYSGIDVPQAFGYPNNGHCPQGNPIPWGPLTWVNGGEPNVAGSVAYQEGSVTYTSAYNSCAGINLESTVWFVVHKHIGRFGRVYYTTDETNGTGSVSLQ